MKTFYYGLAGLALVTLSAVFLLPELALFFTPDACLGVGGRYDVDRLRCDFARPHHGVTFDLWPSWLALEGACRGLSLGGNGVLRGCA